MNRVEKGFAFYFTGVLAIVGFSALTISVLEIVTDAVAAEETSPGATLMVLWGESVQRAGATSEIVTYDQCQNIKAQAESDWTVYCYPLNKTAEKN